MTLTLKTEYALLALSIIASKGKGKPVTRKAMVEGQALSEDFMERVLLSLKKVDLVKSVRGPGGGFVLLKQPADITMWDVYLAVDNPDFKVRQCTPGTPMPCPQWNHCNVKEIWFKFHETMMNTMTSVTLEALAK